jgi:hypothetical protein
VARRWGAPLHVICVKHSHDWNKKKLAGCLVRMGEKRNITVLVTNLDHSKVAGIDWRVILKWILETGVRGRGLDLFGEEGSGLLWTR